MTKKTKIETVQSCCLCDLTNTTHIFTTICGVPVMAKYKNDGESSRVAVERYLSGLSKAIAYEIDSLIVVDMYGVYLYDRRTVRDLWDELSEVSK